MKITFSILFTISLFLVNASAQQKTPNTCDDSTKSEVTASIDFYEKRLAIDSADQLSIYKLGMSNYKLNKLHAAINYFDRLLLLNPKYPAAYANRGICKLMLKDKKGASQDFVLSIKNGYNPKIIDNKKLSEWLKTESSR